MPSKSDKQAKFMRAIAHGWTPDRMKNPPSKAVATDFMRADQKAGKYYSGGMARMYFPSTPRDTLGLQAGGLAQAAMMRRPRMPLPMRRPRRPMPQEPVQLQGGPQIAPNLRGYLQRMRMDNRPQRGLRAGSGNRVGQMDQQGALARALQRGTGRPPMSRRAGFPGTR